MEARQTPNADWNPSRLRVFIATLVVVVAVMVAGFFAVADAVGIYELSTRGLRRNDVIVLMAIRDVSAVIGFLCLAFLIVAAILGFQRFRWVAVGLLILSVVSGYLSHRRERAIYVEIKNNLESIKEAVEKFEQQKNSSATPSE